MHFGVTYGWCYPVNDKALFILTQFKWSFLTRSSPITLSLFFRRRSLKTILSPINWHMRNKNTWSSLVTADLEKNCFLSFPAFWVKSGKKKILESHLQLRPNIALPVKFFPYDPLTFLNTAFCYLLPPEEWRDEEWGWGSTVFLGCWCTVTASDREKRITELNQWSENSKN